MGGVTMPMMDNTEESITTINGDNSHVQREQRESEAPAPTGSDVLADPEHVTYVDHRGLGDLPESHIAQIFCFISPKDIAKLACTSRAFRDAAASDLVWQAKLPKCCNEVLAEARDPPAASSSKKSLYDFLCNGIFLKEGHEAFRVDKATGGVCRSQGARAMGVVWGDDRRYWDWLPREGSSFSEVAYLKAVCWLEVQGHMECTLPVGSYTLSWRISLAETRARTRSVLHHDVGYVYGWSHGHRPVVFTLETDDDQHARCEHYLDPDCCEREEAESSVISGRRMVHQNWIEFDVGEFIVEEGNEDPGVGRINLKYSLTEIKGGHWKSGMFLDGVVIRPSHLKPGCVLSAQLQGSGNIVQQTT